MLRKYILRLPTRIVTWVVAEFPDRVVFKFDIHRGEFGNVPQVVSWLTEILRQYDDDSRPLLIGDPFTGDVLMSLHGSEFALTR
jgi:hypothetical protein